MLRPMGADDSRVVLIQMITQYTRIHPLGTMNVGTTLYYKCQPRGGIRGKVRGLTESLESILWGPLNITRYSSQQHTEQVKVLI